MIQLFIVINMLLLIGNVVKTLQLYRLTDERTENILQVLERQKITIGCELPTYYFPKKQGMLGVETDTTALRDNTLRAMFGETMAGVLISTQPNEDRYFANTRVYTKGSESLAFNEQAMVYINDAVDSNKSQVNLKEAHQLGKQFIKRLKYQKLFRNAYLEEKIGANSIEITYYPKFEGVPVFSSYVRLTITHGSVERAELRVREVSSLDTKGVRQTVYPIDQILFGIADLVEIEAPFTIESITMGYKSIDASSITIFGEQIVPVYKIGIKGLEVPIFVNAYTNMRIE